MRIVALTGLFVVLTVMSTSPADASVENFTQSIFLNMDGLVMPHPCAGEDIELSGFLHLVIHYTLPDDFSGNIIQNYNYIGLVATGQTSGDTYRLTGSYRFVETFASGGGQRTLSFLGHTPIIGKGSTPNAMITAHMHTTLNASGELTAYVDKMEIVCP